jgi:hypothetical protein
VADPSVATLVTSFSKSGVIPQEDLALLSRLQELPIHAPPSARPNCAGIRASTKTEIAAECRLANEAKQKAAEDKKLAAVACKAANLAKKQERLISSAKSKAAKATAKADKLCLKLAKVTIAGATLAAPPSGHTSHSHKKSKGHFIHHFLPCFSAPNRLFVPPLNAWWNRSPPAATLLAWMGVTAQ